MKTAEDVLLAALEETQPATPAGAPPELRTPESGDAAPPLPRSRLLLAAALASLSLAWMLGGVFQGSLARALGVVAVAAGVGTIGLAARISRSALAEYLLVPAAFVVAAIGAIALPNATGSKGTVPQLVGRAIRNGGLLQPPVPFDPGWRFLLVFLVVIVAGALASHALSTRRPLLVPAVVIPLVFGAGLLQAKGSELVSTVVSLAAIAGSLMVIYTSQIAGDVTANRFELRQILRGGLALVAVCALVVGASKFDVLFPDAHRVSHPQPQKPKIVPLSAIKDQVLFTVRAAVTGPWRLGVLDSYRDGTWLLPGIDDARLAPVGSARALAGAANDGKTVDATFTIDGLEGFTLPAMENTISVDQPTARMDSQTQVLRVSQSSPGRGFTYSARALLPPNGTQLTAATGVMPPALDAYTQMPPPTERVRALLATAPANRWDRLQYLRSKLYAKVVAAGPGLPIPVSPARVDAMLNGADASPFEITAAEAMLVRWAGIPARIGYGFFGGDPIRGGYAIHPKHGANWLEAWFPHYGWVAIIGVPPRARASLSSSEKNRNVVTQPSKDLTLQVYIPLQQQNPLLLYVVVRYWLFVASPFVLAALLAWAFFPSLLKRIRSSMRRRWAARHGLHERIAVAYAEFRDAANDLNAGDPYDTPLEYVDRIAPDDEHLELAWLVTRALWGDLARGLTDEDAAAAAAMSKSLRRRLTRAQTPLTRVLAMTSRSSLREPFDRSVPNLWPRAGVRAWLRARVRLPRLRPASRAQRAPGAAS